MRHALSVKLCQHSLDDLGRQVSADRLTRMLGTGRCTVLFDGLDEAADRPQCTTGSSSRSGSTRTTTSSSITRSWSLQQEGVWGVI